MRGDASCKILETPSRNSDSPRLRWGRGRGPGECQQGPVRMVGVNVDVTERKRAALQLRAFTETLEGAVKDRTRELEAQNEARKRAEEQLRQGAKDGSRRSA